MLWYALISRGVLKNSGFGLLWFIETPDVKKYDREKFYYLIRIGIFPKKFF